MPAPPCAQRVQEQLLSLILGRVPLGQLDFLGSNIPAEPGEVRGPGVPEKLGGMGLEGAGEREERVGTLSECTYGSIGDGAWGPGHFARLRLGPLGNAGYWARLGHSCPC